MVAISCFLAYERVRAAALLGRATDVEIGLLDHGRDVFAHMLCNREARDVRGSVRAETAEFPAVFAGAWDLGIDEPIPRRFRWRRTPRQQRVRGV